MKYKGWISRHRENPALLSSLGCAEACLIPVGSEYFVPRVGQMPWVAGLPFFMVMLLVSFVSLLTRHFIHYVCI